MWASPYKYASLGISQLSVKVLHNQSPSPAAMMYRGVESPETDVGPRAIQTAAELCSNQCSSCCWVMISFLTALAVVSKSCVLFVHQQMIWYLLRVWIQPLKNNKWLFRLSWNFAAWFGYSGDSLRVGSHMIHKVYGWLSPQIYLAPMLFSLSVK